MASIVTNLTCELTTPVSVVFLPGNMFSMDNGGNIINVFVVQNGEPATLGGSVSANVIRSDGTTVAITGALEGNKAYIILPQACYAVPGIIHIVMKITEGTTITTIAAITANVYQSSTDAIVDPGTLVPSVAALIAQIEAAVDSIPVDYSGLLLTLAKDYTQKPYIVGEYAWQAGVLKRCIVPITTAETYTAAHWTNAVLGDDVTALKSAFDEKVNDKYTTINPTNWYNKDGFTLGILKANETVNESTTYKYTNYYIPVSPGDVIRFNRGDNFNGLYFRHIAAYDSNKNPLGSTYGYDASTMTFTIPSGVSFVRVTVDVLNNMENLKPMITIGASAPTAYSAYFEPYDVVTTDFVTPETEEQIEKIGGIEVSANELVEIKNDTVSKHTSANLFDGNLNVGYVQANGTVNGSSSYRYTNKIDVHDLIGETIKLYYDGSQGYIRFVCIYDEGNNVKSALGTDTNALSFTIPDGAYYAVISFPKGYADTPYILMTVGTETIYVPKINKWDIKKFPAVDAFVNIAEPLVLSAESLADDGELKAETGNSVKTYGTYAMFCRPGEMTDDDYIIFGKNGSNGYAVGISKTKWAWFVNGNNQGGGTHGLTIKDYLFVTVNKVPGTGAVLTIYTNGGTYTRTNTSWQDYHGLQYIKNESGDTITDVKMTWGSSAFRHGIWFFGDSYTSGSDARWPYYISQLGFSGNILINGYPGEETDIGYKDFIDCIKYGKPTIAVWCLGMNNGDNGEINATWLKYTQAFLDVCELFDITPVLATIPCCPLADHQYKNAWVRASGYRYIEFANAVNVTENSTTWYDGMLSSDNIHPTAQGAKALASQIIVSVPEIVD